MPVADPIPSAALSAPEAAYEHYTRAVAAHNILCADPKATQQMRWEAAIEMIRKERAFKSHFDESLRDEEIEALKAENARARAVLRRAYSLLHAADVVGSLKQMPSDDRSARDQCAVIDLVFLAEDILAAEVEKDLH